MAAAKKPAAKKAAAPSAPSKPAAPEVVITQPAPEVPVPVPAPVPAPDVVEHEQPSGAGDDTDADTDAEKIAPAEGEVIVTVRKGLERFHRCGMRFVAGEARVLRVEDIGPEVLKRLREEPSLVVSGGE